MLEVVEKIKRIDENEIKVLKDATLSSLYVENAEPNDPVFFYRNENEDVKNWSLTYKEVREILESRDVVVREKSDNPNFGVFRIGPKYNWYYSHFIYSTPKKLENEIYKLLVFSMTNAVLLADIEIQNDTHQILTKTNLGEKSVYYDLFPNEISPKESAHVLLDNSINLLRDIHTKVSYENKDGSVTIKICKTFDRFDSKIVAIPKKDLIDQVKVTTNTDIGVSAKIVIAENLVLVAMHNLYNFLNSLRGKISRDQIEIGSSNLFDMMNYNKACQIFNRRIQQKPSAIIYCTSKEEVQTVYINATENDLPIRVRSGGHDHEGECSGTNTIVIDLSRMNTIEVEEATGIATIGPGNRFERLTTELAKNQFGSVKAPVMIPHGTCATVGIAGFTFGGGWGPWTRDKGMCCEYLVEATLVLGDGSIKIAKEDGDEDAKKLLWALRGGGGFSYGIVTELKIQTFELPEELIKFEVEFNPYKLNKETEKLEVTDAVPTIEVLKNWETVINTKKPVGYPDEEAFPNEQLIGTNLKISAIPGAIDIEKFDENAVYHNCIMYGYWKGNDAELEAFINSSFENLGIDNFDFRIAGYGGAGAEEAYGANMMSNWDRVSFYNVKQLLQNKLELGMKKGEPLPPDFDAPAPHKITSRLVDVEGLKVDNSGYKNFLRTLTSPMIEEGNRELGLFSYVTLGAISGRFYQDEKIVEKLNSAFPYKDKQYTIQYQTWWNEDLDKKDEGQNNEVYDRTNRALDWMQVCRDAEIANTSGAFISFKDSSIPTKTYFGDSYEDLKEIKINCSKDKYNHFRTRKTIL